MKLHLPKGLLAAVLALFASGFALHAEETSTTTIYGWDNNAPATSTNSGTSWTAIDYDDSATFTANTDITFTAAQTGTAYSFTTSNGNILSIEASGKDIKFSGGSAEFVRDVYENGELKTDRSATANSLWLDSGYYQNGTDGLGNFSGVSNMYITSSQLYAHNTSAVTLNTNLFLGEAAAGGGVTATMRLDAAGAINFTGKTTLIGAAVIHQQVGNAKTVTFANVDLNSNSITFANMGTYKITSYSGSGEIIASGDATVEIANYNFDTSEGVSLSSSTNGLIKLSGYTGSGTIAATGTTNFELAGATTADQTLTLSNGGTGTFKLTSTSLLGKLVVQSGTVQSYQGSQGNDVSINELGLSSGTQMVLNAEYKHQVALSKLTGEGTLVSACAIQSSQHDGYRATVISEASSFTGTWELSTVGVDTATKNKRTRGVLNTASFGGVVKFTQNNAIVSATGSQLLLAMNSSIAGLESAEGLTNATIMGILATDVNDAEKLRDTSATNKVTPTARTLTITGDKNYSFSGTVDSSITLIIDTNASQTLSGATINGSLQNKGALSISKAVGVTGSVSFVTGATLNILGAGEKLSSTYVPLQTSGLTDVTDSIKYTLFKGAGSITGLTADMISINGTASTGGTLGEGSRDYTVSSTEKAYYVAQSDPKTLADVESAIGLETVNRIYVEAGATLSGVNKMTTQNVVGQGVLQLTGTFNYWNDGDTCFNDFAGEVEIVGSDTLIHVGGAADRFKSSEGIKLKEGATLQVAGKDDGTYVTMTTDVTIAEGNILTNWKNYTFSKVIVDGEATIDASSGNAGTINVANLEIKTGKLTTSGSFSSGTKATIAEGAEFLSNGTTTLESLSGKGTLSSSSSTTVTEASGFTGKLKSTGGDLTVTAATALSAVEAVSGNINLFFDSTNPDTPSVTVTDMVIGAGQSVSVYTLGGREGNLNVSTLAVTSTESSAATLNANLNLTGTTLTLNGVLTLGSELTLGSGNTLSGVDWSSLTNGQSITLIEGVDSIAGGYTGPITAGSVFSNVTNTDTKSYSLVYNETAKTLILQASNVPEPATATLSLLALMGLAARRRRKAAK